MKNKFRIAALVCTLLGAALILASVALLYFAWNGSINRISAGQIIAVMAAGVVTLATGGTLAKIADSRDVIP